MGVTSVVRLVAVHDVFEAFAVVEDALEQTVKRPEAVHKVVVLKRRSAWPEEEAAVVEQLLYSCQHARRSDGRQEVGHGVVLKRQLQNVTRKTATRSKKQNIKSISKNM